MRHALVAAAAAACVLIALASCAVDSTIEGTAGSGSGGSAGGSVCTDCAPSGPLVFRLPSPPGAILWTATTMDKVVREAEPPVLEGTAVELSAARNEFEPFQLVVRAHSSGTVKLQMTPFTGPGQLTRIEPRRVGYVTITAPSDASSLKSGALPDPLEPTTFGALEPVEGGQNQPFWITTYVPPDAPAGDYTSSLTVEVGGSAQQVPIKLHVYDFALPSHLGFDGNWNASFQALGGSESLAAVRALKDFFFEHRLVPSGVAWPAGLNYNGGIEYDCATGSFVENPADPYEFSQLGPAYIDGTGWNGTGFPSFQIMQFVNNSTPRPQTFCGVDRGPDHLGTPDYNAQWAKLLAAIDGYLVARGWQDKGYYYVQNEPQGQADYDVAASLAALARQAAPHLRIAISEEPKPEIAEHPSAQGHSYDLWWADLSHFQPDYARQRQAAGDSVWWYFLYGDLPPHFNPITIDHPGLESRIAFWAAWKFRIKGFAYYSVTGWGADPYGNPRPQGTNQNGDGYLLYPPRNGELVTSIRWELLREGAEDFEYLLLSAGGKMPPTPDQPTACDATVSSAVSSLTSFTRDASALQQLRNQLGAMLEGKANGCPVLDSKLPGAHSRGAYYLNFQDPAGEPKASPLVVDGHEWHKVGWEAYDATQGYGWSGPYIGKADIMKYQYLADAPVNELQRSIVYNDYGRTDTFNWDIENGRYKVTVSIGWHGKSYPQHQVVVEGQVLFDSAPTTAQAPYLVKSASVQVSDGAVTIEAGKFDQYTMLNYVMIEPE